MENVTTFEQVLEKLKELKNLYDIEDIPIDLWKNYLKEAKLRASEIDSEEHRWFRVATNVYELPKFPNRYLGIRHVVQLYSETMNYSDTYFPVEFMEMEAKEIITVIYKPKNTKIK